MEAVQATEAQPADRGHQIASPCKMGRCHSSSPVLLLPTGAHLFLWQTRFPHAQPRCRRHPTPFILNLLRAHLCLRQPRPPQSRHGAVHVAHPPVHPPLQQAQLAGHLELLGQDRGLEIDESKLIKEAVKVCAGVGGRTSRYCRNCVGVGCVRRVGCRGVATAVDASHVHVVQQGVFGVSC